MVDNIWIYIINFKYFILQLEVFRNILLFMGDEIFCFIRVYGIRIRNNK